MVQNAAEGKEDVGWSDNAEQGCSNVELLIVGQQQTGLFNFSDCSTKRHNIFHCALLPAKLALLYK